MLYVFCGTDTKKVADQANRLVSNLKKKRPDAQVFSFEGEYMEVHEIDALVEAKGLFVEKHIVVLKQPTAHPLGKEVVFERLERFAETENIFVITEGKLLASDKKKFETHATKVEEHVRKEEKKSSFNVFALGDSLGSRNRQGLWTGYMQARNEGIEAESIHGTLHWAVRAMLVSSRASSPEEAGQAGFLFSKFKRFSKNFTSEELRDLSRSLIAIYHDARRGKHELGVALEHWILTH